MWQNYSLIRDLRATIFLLSITKSFTSTLFLYSTSKRNGKFSPQKLATFATKINRIYSPHANIFTVWTVSKHTMRSIIICAHIAAKKTTKMTYLLLYDTLNVFFIKLLHIRVMRCENDIKIN